MTIPDFLRTKSLNNIPAKKIIELINYVQASDLDIKQKNIKINAINRFAESNIPMEYWNLKMEKDFLGDNRLLNKYKNYVEDLKSSYFNGKSICLAGSHGSGKTLSLCCVLKLASLKGYTSLYTTMSDVVSVLTQASNEEKISAKKELTMVDFLFIDELDHRFFNSDNAKDLFGKTFETIIRTRMQNKLPVLIATNSPNVKENFISLFKDSLGSLLNKVEIFTVMPGEDFRKKIQL